MEISAELDARSFRHLAGPVAWSPGLFPASHVKSEQVLMNAVSREGVYGEKKVPAEGSE